MYISQNDIVKREKRKTEYCGYVNPLTTLNAKNKKDIHSIEKLLHEWNLSSDTPNVSFMKSMTIVSEAFNGLVETDQNKVAHIICEGLIPKVNYNIAEEGTNILKNNTAINEALVIQLENEVIKNKNCERILNNVSKLNKIVNLNKYIKENANSLDKESSIDCIDTLCERILESYSSIPLEQQYSIVLESLLYSFRKNHINNIKPSDIIYSVTENYLVHGLDINDIMSIASKSKLYTENEVSEGLVCFMEQKVNTINIVTEGNKTEKLKMNTKDSINSMINVFKAEKDKSEATFKELTKKIYARPKEEILDETPNIFGIVRKFFIIGGALAINPALGIITALTDLFIDQEINKKQTEKYIKQMKKEIQKTEDKIDEADGKKLENLNSYKDKLKKDLGRVEEYQRSLYSEKELEKMQSEDDDISFEETCTFILTIGHLFENSTPEHIEDFNDIFMEGSVDVKKTAGSVITGVKLASEKLKKNIKGLSTKERSASEGIDMAVNKYIKVVDDYLKDGARERIIKGSIIPSASKIIKTAISVGALYAINPAIAVVGSLGAIAVSKSTEHREKEYVLDEIETSLKIVEKKITQAEINGDSKELENLYKLEMKLKREKQRITYNLKPRNIGI